MTNGEDTPVEPQPETIEQLRESFFYGSRSNLNMKFLAGLSDQQFGDFLVDVLGAVGDAVDYGDPAAVIEVAYQWQVEAYSGPHKLGESNFRYKYDDTPWAEPKKPLAESRVAVLTSSGHFVDGDDPKPFGVEDMSQAEAEARIQESIKLPPTLSKIPRSTSFDDLRVRHGGYPVQAAIADPQVVLPLRILESFEAEGVIGEVAPDAYSFVGAAAQGRLKKEIGPEWAEILHDNDVDVALLVPI